MKNKSLQEVMNHVARRLEAEAPARALFLPLAPLSAEEALQTADPLLADLAKQYQDSRARLETLIRKNGRADPMTEVAADVADSARSAFETRRLEVLADQTLAAIADRLQEDSERELDRRRASALQRAREYMFQSWQEQVLRQVKKKHEDDTAFMLFLMWMLQATLHRARYAVSLAHIFVEATRPAPLREAAG